MDRSLYIDRDMLSMRIAPSANVMIEHARIHGPDERKLNLARNDVDHRRPVALVGHVMDAHSGQHLEQFSGKVPRTADTPGTETQLTRILAGKRNQFPHVVRRHGRLSTITVWPRRSVSRCATTRATVSVPLSGAGPTMKRIGFVGYAAPCAPGLTTQASTTPAARQAHPDASAVIRL